MGRPSATASASGPSGSSTGLAHLARQARERPRDRHARVGGGRLAERAGDLVVRTAHLNAEDHGLSIAGAETFERHLVALDCLGAYRALARRWVGRWYF